MRDGHVVGYVGHGQLAALPDARAAVFAIRTGGGATLYVAGVDAPAATMAASELARHPGIADRRYALALDANGHIVAQVRG
jgi:hypothetical protein